MYPCGKICLYGIQPGDVQGTAGKPYAVYGIERRFQKLRTGTLTDADWDAVVEGIGVIGNSKLIIDDTPGISITELRSKCRKMKLEHGLSLVIIDYLQLMSGSKKGGNDNRQQEISEISRSLKLLPESFMRL